MFFYVLWMTRGFFVMINVVFFVLWFNSRFLMMLMMLRVLMLRCQCWMFWVRFRIRRGVLRLHQRLFVFFGMFRVLEMGCWSSMRRFFFMFIGFMML